jgi:hypothetical protein
MYDITQLPNKKNFNYFCKIGYVVRIIPLVILFYFQSCGLDIEDPTPPSPPQWVQKSVPDEWPERGIDAHESGGIFLEWESNLEDDIGAYYIYRATWYELNDSLGDFDLLTILQIKTLSQLYYIDRSAVSPIRYYYKIKAENASNDISEYSDSTTYRLLPSIDTQLMVPNGVTERLNEERYLIWYYLIGMNIENYQLTITDMENNQVSRVALFPSDYSGNKEQWQIPSEVILDSGKLYNWRIDICADYVDEFETSGSESGWARFLFF